MKRISLIFLTLCLCLLCFGCNRSTEPTIRYEDSTAYYTQKGSQCTMDLQFEAPVTEGSTITLLANGEEILTFLSEGEFSRLRLSSPLLEKGGTYTLTVNGVLQRHGKTRPVAQETQPGEIPEPTIATIPQEPMGETSVTTESSDSDSSLSPFDNPPTIAEDIESIPSLREQGATASSPTVSSDGTLDSQPINADKVQKDNDALKTDVEVSGTTFTITNTVTGFTSVQNAS